MSWINPPPVLRIRVPAIDGGEPRSHPKQPHPTAVVAQVRHLIETTRLPHRTIAARAGVNAGTISRWAAKYGWTRPPGAWASQPRPERRYVPVLIGRVLAQRLRVQAERLLTEIESAPRVDPAALAEAARLLEQARAEQAVRRTRRLQPPPPPDPAALAEAERAREVEAERDRILAEHGRDRRAAALKGWKGRYSKRVRHHAWMLERSE